jgi:hypothetical protein
MSIHFTIHLPKSEWITLAAFTIDKDHGIQIDFVVTFSQPTNIYWAPNNVQIIVLILQGSCDEWDTVPDFRNLLIGKIKTNAQETKYENINIIRWTKWQRKEGQGYWAPKTKRRVVNFLNLSWRQKYYPIVAW